MCASCEPGKFMNETQGTACYLCTPGSYCESGASAPLPCKEGTYSSSPGLSSDGQCLACPRGSACSTGATEPAICNPGTFAPKAGMPRCELCQPGSYQPEYNSTGCIACAVASYCPGYGTTSPTPCPGGTYSNEIGLTADWQCTSVKAGNYSSTGSRFPERCPDSGFVCPGRAADSQNAVPGSKPIPVGSGKATDTERVEVVQFDLLLDLGPNEAFNQQDFITNLATELGIDGRLISVEVTPLDVRRRLSASRRRLNSSSTPSDTGGRLKLVVTIQVPQELDQASIPGGLEASAGLGDASFGSTHGTAPSAADILRSQVNGNLASAALGVNFTMSGTAAALMIEKEIEVDCARGYCKGSPQTMHTRVHLHLCLSRGRVQCWPDGRV